VRAAFRALALVSLALLSACVSRAPTPPPVGPPPIIVPPPPPANALQAGIARAEPQSIAAQDAESALIAFRRSCPSLVKRNDASGLTRPEDWAPLCADAATVQSGAAAEFFRNSFDWVRVGKGEAFATGYYEPEIAGSQVQAPGYTVPFYRVPPDLTRCTKPDGTSGRGRLDETGVCVLYYTRAEIEDGVLAGKGLELAWGADPVEVFFLEIQGSGRLKLPDGSVTRIGYADQNGREYVAIGRLLRERNLLPAGGASMPAIVDWLRANPDAGRALMRENLSYIFFKELTGPGPIGALGVAVSATDSVAADRAFVPLGAPVFLTLDRPEANGLWVAQDTGGAIKGANRFDTFWGAGSEAERIAGGMSAKGSALILLPKASVARATARP
jgi:membrane-bound lytic murein transglycosylase A